MTRFRVSLSFFFIIKHNFQIDSSIQYFRLFVNDMYKESGDKCVKSTANENIMTYL